MLGGCIYTIKTHTEALLFSSKKVGLEVNAVKFNYIFLYRNQNAGQNHNIKIATTSFKNVVKCKCLGWTPKIQTCMYEEIKRMLSGCVIYKHI
jgi:hypothetical protein